MQTQESPKAKTTELYAIVCESCKQTLHYDNVKGVNKEVAHLIHKGQVKAIGENSKASAKCLVCWILS